MDIDISGEISLKDVTIKGIKLGELEDIHMSIENGKHGGLTIKFSGRVMEPWHSKSVFAIISFDENGKMSGSKTVFRPKHDHDNEEFYSSFDGVVWKNGKELRDKDFSILPFIAEF